MTELVSSRAEDLGSELPPRLAVPWLTVVPLAVAMAYGDGFWVVSLRGAVGSIERTDAPFAHWLRESTLLLPLFVVAVLGALTLALRRFGPVLRGPRAVTATMLLIVAAGTLAGVATLSASSAYDYQLQSQQLDMMGSMGGTCTGECLAQQQQASLALQVRSVGYGSGILLVTNVVLVGWVVAMRGGRLNLVSSPRRSRGQPEIVAAGDRAPRGRGDDLRLLLAVGLAGSAVIHAAVVPEHLTEWVGAGTFFILLAAAQLGLGALLLGRVRKRVLLAAALVSVAPLAVWSYSRSLGLPFGPEAGVPEQVGLADSAACALEVATLLLAVVLLRGRGSLRRPQVSAHLRWLTVTAVVAVMAIGLAGTGFARIGGLGEAGVQSHPTAHP